jgi:C1A family cysteine protease
LSKLGLGDTSLLQLEDDVLAPSHKTLEQQGKVFHNQSHTVLIVGWGVDETNQTKYWIIRNSYGPRWGEKGDFKVQRGSDDFGIEANLISYEPVLCSEASQETCIPI